MVMVQLEGGLGSQMFGYATARRLALVHGVEVMLDLRNYETYTKFSPELHHFNIQASTLTPEESSEICGPDNSRVRVIEPRHLHFDSSILDVPDPYVLLVGNCISEDYFFDVTDVIRKDFTRKTALTPYGERMQQLLRDVERKGFQPVAVHVRLGDKLYDPSVNRVHGTCSKEYYQNALALMGRMVERPWFVFFSDNPEWVLQQFSGDNFTIAEPPADTPAVEDMTLMTYCRHHILGNSTYSWWGAWLANAADQIVIGPRPFIADRSINTEDMLLRNWISLSAVERPVSILKPPAVVPTGFAPSVTHSAASLTIGSAEKPLRI